MPKLSPFLRHWFKTLTIKKIASLTVSLFILAMMLHSVRACSKYPLIKPVYRIGQDVRWYGLNLMGKEKNMTAFSDELLTTIAKQDKLTFQFFSFIPNELLQKLENKTVDGILSSLQPNFNNRTLIFSDPYFLVGPVLIVPLHSNLDNPTELSHKIIGVQTNSSTSLELEKDSTIQVRLYDDILQALSDLDEKHIDGVLFPAIPSIIYINTFYPDRFKIATSPLTNEGLRLIALNNIEGKALIEYFNKQLEELKKDGTYDFLIEKWGLVQTQQPPS